MELTIDVIARAELDEAVDISYNRSAISYKAGGIGYNSDRL